MNDLERTVQDAVTAAEGWLKLVDADDFDGSWNQAAALFKNAVNEEKWSESLVMVRGMFGKALSRAVKSTKYATELPGAPDGEYVVIEYETEFEKKRNAVETVTPMKDPDGQWRVSGYFIR